MQAYKKLYEKQKIFIRHTTFDIKLFKGEFNQKALQQDPEELDMNKEHDIYYLKVVIPGTHSWVCCTLLAVADTVVTALSLSTSSSSINLFAIGTCLCLITSLGNVAYPSSNGDLLITRPWACNTISQEKTKSRIF